MSLTFNVPPTFIFVSLNDETYINLRNINLRNIFYEKIIKTNESYNEIP